MNGTAKITLVVTLGDMDDRIDERVNDRMNDRMDEHGDSRALEALQRYFGYESFRPGQAGIVNALLNGRDVLGVMPTGAGKSICYQIPATILPGISLVVSPLISLMQDQVDALNDVGIPALFVNGMQTPDQQDFALSMAANGQAKLLYVAPERLETQRFQNFASHTPISMVAVDEAHCVSQWGQDFRSSYLGIGEFIAKLPTRPAVAAFTATATERVRRDIISILGLANPSITVTGFDRPNLYFDILKLDTKNKTPWIARYVADHPNESGIVYCATRKETEALAASLNHTVPVLLGPQAETGRVAVAYHGGMSPEVREQAQRDFVNDRVPVVVATNAFGMGIDKSNVRYVIHHNMPESIEAYYQEAGRAGRDGEPSRCTLLWNESDIVTRRRLLDNDYENARLTPEEQEVVRVSKRHLLDGMVGYCRTTECLHTYMTRYFGERSDADAGVCDGGCANCGRAFETVDVTDMARAISMCVHDVQQKVGVGKIVKILRGSKSQDLAVWHPETMATYGMLGSVSEAQVRDVLNQMVADGFLCISEGRLPLVGFGVRAAETVSPQFHYEMKRVKRRVPSRAVSGQGGLDGQLGRSLAAGGVQELDGEEERLFQKLRELRLAIAREIGKPPYIVFSDKSLRDMARIRPTTRAQMLGVSGVGEVKMQRYGERFLDVIRAVGERSGR